MSNTLTLHTTSLFSKFGFNDGDIPHHVYDWLTDEMWDSHRESWSWHDVLIDLVTDHLLIWLEGRVETYTLVTGHNPIRAKSLDGRVVDIRNDDLEGLVETLPVQSVEISKEIVVNYITNYIRNFEKVSNG